MRAAIYTRISKDQTGEGLGVQRQLDACLALADRLGWAVVTRYDDNDLSAYNGKTRPGFEALLDGMKRGDFDAVICWHTDRLYRSLKDLVRLLEVAVGVDIRTVCGGDLDLSTPTGRMLATILGGVAVQESEHKGERQREANEQRAAAGKWHTANRPFGYTMNGEALEPEASAVRQAAADVLAGKSIRRVAMEWNEAGLRSTLAGQERKSKDGTVVKVVDGRWNSPRVRQLLLRPRYAGLRVYRGKVVGKGDWEPLIDEDTHRGLVAFLSDPSRAPRTKFERKYQGAGVYRCGKCGGPMRTGKPKGGRRTYLCREYSHVVRQGEPLDRYVEMLVLDRLSRPDVHLMLADGDRLDLPTLHARREALQARLDEAAGMFAKREIDGAQLRRITNDLRTEVAGVDKVLADAARVSPVTGLISESTDRDEVRQRWEALSPDLRGKVIDELMTVTVMPAPRGTNGFHPEHIRIEWK